MTLSTLDLVNSGCMVTKVMQDCSDQLYGGFMKGSSELQPILLIELMDMGSFLGNIEGNSREASSCTRQQNPAKPTKRQQRPLRPPSMVSW